MSVTLHIEPLKSGWLPRRAAKAAATALVLGGLALAVLFVAFMRTFAFEYFHGDRAAAQVLFHLLFGN